MFVITEMESIYMMTTRSIRRCFIIDHLRYCFSIQDYSTMVYLRFHHEDEHEVSKQVVLRLLLGSVLGEYSGKAEAAAAFSSTEFRAS